MQVDLQHPVLLEVRRRAIPFTVSGSHVEIAGFDRLGTVTLRSFVEGQLVLHDPQGPLPLISTFSMLVERAWHWLYINISQRDGRYQVHENWREAFIENGWLPADTLQGAWVDREMWLKGEEKRKCSM